ncbi:hypothetical protein [Zavarzinia sp. CC-PAN008]|uniref:hypothetical protein n=1 Tax=Zavarzinia sp. CC-PAN008 TaxID=3243332 RepID=UPI003F745D9A
MGYLQTAVDWLRSSRHPAAEPLPQPLRVLEHQPIAADTASLDPRLVILSLSQIVWGDGLIGPFDPGFVDEAVRDLAMTKDSSVAFLNAELGGPACALAQASSAWITAFESNQDLARYAGPIIGRQNTENRVELRIVAPPVAQRARPGRPAPAPPKTQGRRYDCVVAYQRLLRGEPVSSLVPRAVALLKPGSLLLIDDVVGTGAAAEALTEALKGAGLEIRAWREHSRLTSEMAEPLRRLGILTRKIDELSAIVGREAANHLLTVATAASMVQSGLDRGNMAAVRVVARLPSFSK